MFNVFELMTDNGSIARLRRSTMIMSLLILVVASLRFNSNQVDFFGLVISFEQDRFVLIARIFWFYVAVTYFLRTFSFLLNARIQNRRKGLENDEHKIVASGIREFHEALNQHDYDANDQYNVDLVDEEEQKIKANAKKIVDDKSLYLDRWQQFITYTKKTDAFLYYVLPFVLAIVAIVFPALLSQILDFFQGQ